MAQSHNVNHLPLSSVPGDAGPGHEVPEEDQSAGLKEIAAALGRRKAMILIVFVIIFSLSVAAAVALPRVYRSTATILIEQQQIPVDLIRSTVSSYASERIQNITERLFATDSAIAIIEKFNLYADQREKEPPYVLAQRLRADLTVEMVTADVLDDRSGRLRATTIAFTISFDSPSPTEAQHVTNEMVSLYLKENLKARTGSAADTTNFLIAERDKLATELNALETGIASFKKMNMGRLPEQLAQNQRAMQRIDEKLLDAESQIRSLEERRIVLKAAMIQIDAVSGSTAQNVGSAASAGDRLQDLRVQYVGLSAVYAADHPDVARLRKEIEALKKEVAPDGSVTVLRDRLEDHKSELAAARMRYSPQHPDVKRLEREETSLAEELEAVTAAAAKAPSLTFQTEDPAYIELQTQRELADSEILILRAQQAELRKEYAIVESLIGEMPEIERQHSLLVRDRENLMAVYVDITSKLSGARISEALESNSKGERFSLIQPPNLPTKAFKPNRPKILALGLIGSVSASLGLAVLIESLFKRIHGPESLARLLGNPPIGVIPYIENSRDRRRRRFKRWAIGLSFVAILTVSAVLFHLWVMPMDLLWVAMQAFVDGGFIRR